MFKKKKTKTGSITFIINNDDNNTDNDSDSSSFTFVSFYYNSLRQEDVKAICISDEMGVLATAVGQVVSLHLARKMLYRQSHWQRKVCGWQQAPE